MFHKVSEPASDRKLQIQYYFNFCFYDYLDIYFIYQQSRSILICKKFARHSESKLNPQRISRLLKIDNINKIFI